MTPFYKDSVTGTWVLGNKLAVVAGTYELEYNSETGQVTIVSVDGRGSLYGGRPSEFSDQSGTAYTDLTAFMSAVKYFFFKLRDLRTNQIFVVSDDDPTDYVEIDPTFGVRLHGDASVFDDLSFDVTRAKTVGTRVVFNDTEATMEFSSSATLTDYLILSTQLKHAWRIGSIVYPHIHFEQTQAALPSFMLQIRWQSQGSLKTTAWTNYKCKTPAITYVSGTLNQIVHGIPFTPPADAMLSDIIQVRVIRDTANASGLFTGDPAYTGVASVTSVDIHIELDSMGSDLEYIKNS